MEIQKSKKPLRISAGCLIILNKSKVLLGHPSNNSWSNCFSPPKGGVEEGESLLEAAIRETKEEMSIDIIPSMISNLDLPHLIDYSDKSGRVFKKVYFYVVHIHSISQVGLSSEVLEKSNLQIEELDWAGFLTKSDLKDKVFHRFWPLIDSLV